MRHFHVLLLRLIAGLALTGSSCHVVLAQAVYDPSAASPQIVVFDAPGALSSSTTPVAINARGTITGYYQDFQSVTHGFIRLANGHIDNFEVGCELSITTCTVPSGINVFGVIIGSEFPQQGFVRFPDGHSVTIGFGQSFGTQPTAINAAGTVVGWTDLPTGGVGFIRTPDGSTSIFTVPGAALTAPAAINLFGQITGEFSDPAGQHGFIRNLDGSFTTFDPPGSRRTAPTSISFGGTVAGTYSTGTYSHGFLRQADGTFAEFDVPGSPSVRSAIISPTGTVAGSADFGTQTHGYIRAPNGTFTVFDPPGSRTTFVSGINAFGVITGVYQDVSSRFHAYVRVPSGRRPFTEVD